MSPHRQRSRSIAELVTLALSAIVVGSLVVVALNEEARRQNEPGANLSVSFDNEAARMAGESFYIPYTVTNTGSTAIMSADIWIEVFDDQTLVESAAITVEFLPLQGKQHGIYVSRLDPRTHQLRGRLEALQLP
jgi:uncharacterized protein (TIGR02588 family)